MWRSSTNPAAEKSPSNAKAELILDVNMTWKLVASTNEYSREPTQCLALELLGHMFDHQSF